MQAFEQQYSLFESRSVNDAQQTLWKVNDDFIGCPEERFLADQSPYVTTLMEQQMGPMEAAPVPKGLIKFIEDMACAFGAVPSEYTGAAAVAFRVMYFLDYTEPYFLLVDAPISLISNQLSRTYRVKKSMAVIPPEEVETFQVVGGFDFRHYNAADNLLRHPQTKAILRGDTVLHSQTGVQVTRKHILERICNAIYGDGGIRAIEAWVDEWLMNVKDEIEYDKNTSGEPGFDASAIVARDEKFWLVGTIAGLLWFKSPFALRFLIENHPIYASVLEWDTVAKQPKIIPSSGGEALIWGWDIYNHDDLVIEDVRPGTCAICSTNLHCTKMVNSWGVKHPICSCGKAVKIEVTNEHDFVMDHHKEECAPYQDQFPNYGRVDFLCQHCLFGAMNGLPSETKCGRAQCPNTACPHHMGQSAHIRTLTKQRRLMLTSQPSQSTM